MATSTSSMSSAGAGSGEGEGRADRFALGSWTSIGQPSSEVGSISWRSGAEAGDALADATLNLAARALDQLRNLKETPTRETETATLRWIRQSRRYPLWRVSHAFRPDVALRLICWFPPESGTVVVALFAGNKARMGDVFYNSVGARADALIDQWKRETSYEEKP